MDPHVAILRRHHDRSHPDSRERLPVADYPVRKDMVRFTYLPDKHVIIAVNHEGQSRIRRILMEHDLAARHGKTEFRGIRELGVFLRHMAVAVFLADSGRVGDYISSAPVYDHIGLEHHFHLWQSWKRCGLRAPERVVIRKRQTQKRLHSPVRRPRRIVALRHD